MYSPAHFEENRVEVLQNLVRAHPLATLVCWSGDALVANLVPLVFRSAAPAEGRHGSLVGHIARANPLWQTTDFSVPVLAIFQGPAHYISPNWYPSKARHGKVVPTWNYVVVQARGRMQLHHDPAWIRAQVTELTTQQEASQAQPWSVDDAPAAYTDALLGALIGIEIPVDDWTGKWKVSQNQSAENRAGVVQGLLATPPDPELARHGVAMGRCIQERE